MADRKDYSQIKQEIMQEIEADPVLNPEVDAFLNESEDAPDLESEVGLNEVYLTEAELEAIPSDDTDDNLDVDDDGAEAGIDGDIDNSAESDIDAENISDQPQELTQSYGTGLQGRPSDRAGRRAHFSQSQAFNEADAVLTGGDIDANYEQANAVGDESVGGTVATPDQDIVDELGAAVGLEMDDRSFLRTNDILNERDDRRWELDPMSAEDYNEHQAADRE